MKVIGAMREMPIAVTLSPGKNSGQAAPGRNKGVSMKIYCVLVVFLLLFASTAGANTLQIVGGTMGASQQNSFDTGAYFTLSDGQLFSMQTPYPLIGPDLGSNSTLVSFPYWAPWQGWTAQFQFLHEPVFVSQLVPGPDGFSTAFTMTGVLTPLGGTGIDVFGQGRINLSWTGFGAPSINDSFHYLNIAYQFSADSVGVPESTSLLLLAFALPALLFVRGRPLVRRRPIHRE